MNRRKYLHQICVCLCACALIQAACGPSDDVRWNHTYDVPTSACEDGPGERTLRVDVNSRSIGPSSNALVEGPDQLWLMQSGDNTLAPVGDGPEIDVGDNHNPYDSAYDAARDHFYITNFLTDTVTVADASTGEIVEEIEHESFDWPNGVAVSESYVYVTNSGFRPEGDYAPGRVTVIDPATRSVLGSIETARRNPQFATWAQTSAGPRLIVVDTGQLGYEGDDFSPGPGAVEIWRETPDPLTPEKSVAQLDVPSDSDVGAPGRAVVSLEGDRAYFTSATAPVLFELDLDTGDWIRGADNPIELYAAQGEALDHAALGRDGILYVSAFNREQLILVDTRCDVVLGRFDISANDALNSGPHAIAIAESDSTSARGFIIGSLSNALIEFTVQ